MQELLPLEQNAIMTEINKELKAQGTRLLVWSGKWVFDCRSSVYEVLNHINALFPNLAIPFSVIYDRAIDFVVKTSEFFDKLINKGGEEA